MARKVFWLLWITFWPAVAIIPPLVTASSQEFKPTETAATSASTPDKNASTKVAHDQATTAAIKQLDDAIMPIPRRAIEQPQTDIEELPPIPRSSVSVEPSTESMEDIEGTNKLSAAQSKSSSNSKLTSGPAGSQIAARANRGIRPALTMQEEQAQKSIHERAASRAVERKQRLAAKYHGRQGQNLAAPTPRWQPHLTQSKWLAGSRSSTSR